MDKQTVILISDFTDPATSEQCTMLDLASAAAFRCFASLDA